MIDKLNVILNIDNLQAKCDSPPPVMQDLCLQVKDGVQKRTLIYHLGKHRVIHIENQLLLNIKVNRDEWWLLFYDSY